MSDEGIFSAVRCFNVKTIQALASAREHAFRRDENSQKRVDLSRTDMSLASSEYAPDNPRDVVQAFKSFKERTGIKEQKGASVALHMLCVVSPEWLAETGDPRDPENPRVKELFTKSQEWAEQKFGLGSVIASRLDVDEAGSGVVDVFVCPSSVVGQKNRPGQDKRVISTRKALKNIQREYKKKRSFMALQDSFAEFCQSNLDERIQRGIPKELSQREHVHADIYRPAVQEAKQVREFAKSEAMQIRSDAEQEAEQIAEDAEKKAEQVQALANEILREAEEQKTQIYEDAKKQGLRDGADEFATSDLITRVVLGASMKALNLREEGKREGISQTAKKAKETIKKWEKKDKQSQDRIKKLIEERDNIKESLKDYMNKSYDNDKPFRDLQKQNEQLQGFLGAVFESLDMHGINPIPYIKTVYTIDDLMRDCDRIAKEWLESFQSTWEPKTEYKKFER